MNKIIKKYELYFIIAFVFSMIFKPILCALLMGLFAITYAIYYFKFLKRIKYQGVRSNGVIIRYERDYEGYKTPIIKFKTKAGNTIEMKPDCYSSSDLSKLRSYNNNINKRVSILYNPDKPEEFIIANEMSFFKGTLVLLMLMGFIFVFVAISNLLGYIEISNMK